MTKETLFKKGTLFMVCTHDELLEKGWEKEQPRSTRYIHDDFDECLITSAMIDEWHGQVLTVKDKTSYDLWYFVEENEWKWPVATFLITDPIEMNVHACVEGMTPIDGWFICKTCGTNLKEIIK